MAVTSLRMWEPHFSPDERLEDLQLCEPDGSQGRDLGCEP